MKIKNCELAKERVFKEKQRNEKLEEPVQEERIEENFDKDGNPIVLENFDKDGNPVDLGNFDKDGNPIVEEK